MKNNVKLELTFDLHQAEAFAHLLDATAASLEDQQTILKEAIKGLEDGDKKTKLEDYLVGTELQLLLSSTIRDQIINKLKDHDKPKIYTPQDIINEKRVRNR